MENDQYLKQPVYQYLLVIYVTLLVGAFATASKLVALPFGFSASVSTITFFAFSFVITDIISEVYGYQAAKKTVRMGFVAAFIAVILFQVAVALPSAAEGYVTQESFNQIFGHSLRLIIGGMVGFYLSQRVDVFIYHHLKKQTKGKHLWLRNNVSTACAQLVDSCVWITVAFAGIVPDLSSLIMGEYIVKLSVALLDTAIIYIVIARLRRTLRNQPLQAKLERC